MTFAMLLVQFAMPVLTIAATVMYTAGIPPRSPLGACHRPDVAAALALHRAASESRHSQACFVVSAFFTGLYTISLWEQWIAPWAKPVWQAMRDGEWGLWWYRSYDTMVNQSWLASGFPETEINAEQWARHAGPPVDGDDLLLVRAVDQSAEIDRLIEKCKMNTALQQQKTEGLDWCDTQPVDPSPDGVPWTDAEKDRWHRNATAFAAG